MGTRIFLLLAVSPLLLVAGACGSSDQIVVETGSLSKREFVERADNLCERSKGRFLAAFRAAVQSQGEGPPRSEQAEVAELVENNLVPTFEELIERIGSLGAPSSEYAEQVSEFLNALQEGLDTASERPVTALEGTAFLRAFKLARKYGLIGCANSL